MVAEPRACLREVELFHSIPEEEMEQLNRMLPLHTYAPGEIIYNPQQPQQILFIVKKGSVRVFHTSATGKTFTLAVYKPGDVFGSMPILGQEMGASYAEALQESALCQLSQEQVRSFFLSDPRIAQQVALLMSQRVLELEERLSDLALRPLSQRVASLLLRMQNSHRLPWKQHTVVRLTHEQLAGLAGASREAVSKVLADLAHSGLIRQRRGSIILLDPQELEIFKETGTY